jgi:hypothetical protein
LVAVELSSLLMSHTKHPVVFPALQLPPPGSEVGSPAHTANWTDRLRPSKLILLVQGWESGQAMLPVEVKTLSLCFDRSRDRSGSPAENEKAQEVLHGFGKKRQECLYWCSIPPGHDGGCVFHATPQPGSKRWKGMVARLREDTGRGTVIDARRYPKEMLKEAGVEIVNYQVKWRHNERKKPRTLKEWIGEGIGSEDLWKWLRDRPNLNPSDAWFDYVLQQGDRWFLRIEERGGYSCRLSMPDFVEVVSRSENGGPLSPGEIRLLDLCFDRKPPTLKGWLGDRLRRLGYSLTEALGPWEAVLREAPVAGGRYGRFEWRKIWNHWELHVPAGNEARGPLSAEEIVYATGRNLRGQALDDGLSAFWESTMGCFFTRRPDMPEETRLPKRASAPRLRPRPLPSLKGQPGLPWNGNEGE